MENEIRENISEDEKDEYGGATATIPLSKLLKIVSELAVVKAESKSWEEKYWILYGEAARLRRDLAERSASIGQA